eukprot:CAMPEP_0113546966 /NCGR_PEP_ID=MMETSP0015_2-20120614/12096_1 /TAXON_ID=2838 /ORGANISM="Odontella" /LENGTH=211 /DNA_ID=CAMNT_0000447473 /DNA_START=51 /DNA_END=683 /DNA_ORIENTATION=- /assembly_acc=CAM_ASM_000160
MTVPANKEGRVALGESAGSPPAEVPLGGNSPSVGRVVRLHFACRAPLPLGYTLRVTSSTLWAPSAQGALAGDDAAAEALSSSVANDAYHSGSSNAPGGSTGLGSSTVRDSAEMAAAGGSGEYSGGVGVYSSSVEMITTPETYPVWRTRRPVAVVVRPQQRERRRSSRSLSARMSVGAQAIQAAAAAAELTGPDRRGGGRGGNLDGSADLSA